MSVRRWAEAIGHNGCLRQLVTLPVGGAPQARFRQRTATSFLEQHGRSSRDSTQDSRHGTTDSRVRRRYAGHVLSRLGHESAAGPPVAALPTWLTQQRYPAPQRLLIRDAKDKQQPQNGSGLDNAAKPENRPCRTPRKSDADQSVV